MWAHQLNGYHRPRSRLRAPAVCLVAIALLYGGSFFTRDWRAPALHQPGQPLAEQVAVRPTRGTARPMSVSAIPAESAPQTVTGAEPEATGALPKNGEPVTNPPSAAAAPP